MPDAIRQADISPGLAVGVARNFDSISDLVFPEAHAAVLDAMITVAADGGPTAVRDLRVHLRSAPGGRRRRAAPVVRP